MEFAPKVVFSQVGSGPGRQASLLGISLSLSPKKTGLSQAVCKHLCTRDCLKAGKFSVLRSLNMYLQMDSLYSGQYHKMDISLVVHHVLPLSSLAYGTWVIFFLGVLQRGLQPPVLSVSCLVSTPCCNPGLSDDDLMHSKIKLTMLKLSCALLLLLGRTSSLFSPWCQFIPHQFTTYQPLPRPLPPPPPPPPPPPHVPTMYRYVPTMYH